MRQLLSMTWRKDAAITGYRKALQQRQLQKMMRNGVFLNVKGILWAIRYPHQLLIAEQGSVMNGFQDRLITF